MSHFKLFSLKTDVLKLRANMSAQVLFYFTAFLVIIVSLESAFARSSNVKKTKNVTDLDSGKVIVKGNYMYNAVNLYPEKDVKTALSQLEKKIESLEGRLDALEKFKSACEFDFENGIDDWKKTGTVFNNQPTYGDNPTARNREPSNQQGNWWIGGAENRSSKSSPAGNTQGDGPQGTLTSPLFTITGKNISFLIGGGCDIKLVRAELVIGSKVVKQATARCNETMTREAWDVGAFVGQRARVKLVDSSSGAWGHINFDDLRGDMSCGPN